MSDQTQLEGGRSREERQDRLQAGVEMMGRFGAKSIDLRYQDDKPPTVWIAVGEFETEQGIFYDAAGGMFPDVAVVRLCVRFGDGGECTHCHRPVAINEEWEVPTVMADHICWYSYDPERKTFRRGCEGNDEQAD